MTASKDAMPNGEKLLQTRRRKFWRYMSISLVVFGAAGFLSGYLTDAFQAGEVPLWLPLAVIAVTIVALIYSTRDYLRRIDELDLMDNLWAHLIGFYGGLISFGAWYLLAELGVTTQPNAEAIIIAALAVMLATYGLRKLGWR
ncbi:hypothetical protein P7228_13565 [Altererythrobacter arenosus]|uniref:Uncharacterized protein n=1 Tax=Altererythrobacter arenosus TaxID=3032592 RepID=A0ABY8FPR9_9SPHN|nr:hypothetical protein [Altererythrobacter sp. CAU 1644]WFL77006.1 hypothetical protein P7228_13565 [Altererythrobacter sp. CAU 1644]